MKINRLSQLKIFSAFFAAVLSVGAAYASDPGVTDTEIVIGLHAPLSGPLAAFGQDPLQAAKMWYEDVNRRGGIHGRKIRVIAEDDKCNANEVGALARKFVRSS